MSSSSGLRYGPADLTPYEQREIVEFERKGEVYFVGRDVRKKVVTRSLLVFIRLFAVRVC